MPQVGADGEVVYYIYGDDHDPPHYHARGRGWGAAIRIADCVVLAGRLPKKHSRRVLRWCRRHSRALSSNWQLIRNHERPRRIRD